jgi:hypothetical protein
LIVTWPSVGKEQAATRSTTATLRARRMAHGTRSFTAREPNVRETRPLTRGPGRVLLRGGLSGAVRGERGRRGAEHRRGAGGRHRPRVVSRDGARVRLREGSSRSSTTLVAERRGPSVAKARPEGVQQLALPRRVSRRARRRWSGVTV